MGFKVQKMITQIDKREDITRFCYSDEWKAIVKSVLLLAVVCVCVCKAMYTNRYERRWRRRRKLNHRSETDVLWSGVAGLPWSGNRETRM